ncbi:MAG: RHS repeat domain-containing protein, partial [Blastocatellia bacterium]
PEAGTVSYEYWANDLVKKVTDARGIYAQFTWNPAGMLTDADYSDSTFDVHYRYGEYGERTLMQEKEGATVRGSTSYGYDSFKRLTSETRSFYGLAGTHTVNYQYNNADMLTRVNYVVRNAGNQVIWDKNVNYGYTYAAALAGVGTNIIGSNPDTTTNVATNLAYRGFGGVKSMNFGNTRRLEAGYNINRQQMTSLVVKKQDGTDTIINQSYNYNNNGNNGRIQKITDNVDGAYTTTYAYDAYNRLQSATATAYTRGYSYDPWGNLTGVTATGAGETGSYTLSYANNGTGAPATNRINNTGYSYDNAGNMTGDGAQTFSYDAASRLKTATGNGSAYDYDGDGRRVKQQLGATTKIFYLWSSLLEQPMVELDQNGWIYRAYVYGPGGGQAIAQLSYDGGFYWTHTDHLGSGRKLTNTSGAVVYRGEFDPHGQALYEWQSSGQTYLNSHKFTGYERDWATNLNYAKARTYVHNRGRFMQSDPLGLGAADVANPQSLNLYSYAQNDPVNFIDPTGTDIMVVVTNCLTIHAEDGTIIDISCESTYYIIGGGPVRLPFGGGGGGGESGGGCGSGGGIQQDGGGQQGGIKVYIPDKDGKMREVRPPDINKTGKEIGRPDTRIPEGPRTLDKIRLPNDATRWQKFRFNAALVLRILGNFLKTVPIIVDPKALCENDPTLHFCGDQVII